MAIKSYLYRPTVTASVLQPFLASGAGPVVGLLAPDVRVAITIDEIHKEDLDDAMAQFGFVFVAEGVTVSQTPRVGVVPLGVINGTNKVFSLAEDFEHDGLNKEAVYLRGLRRSEGVGCDYVASESGGPGTGYDTLTFANAPKVGDTILIDYFLS